jgi:quinoprotein glucose dehydrogenase
LKELEMAVKLTAIVLVLLGLLVFGLGAQLMMLGGSLYYVIAGVIFIITGVLLFKRSKIALHLYALLVIGSIIWALYEVGLDWWQLGPRGGIIILLGLWMLTPWVRNRLTDDGVELRGFGHALPLVATSVIAILVAVVSMFNDPQDNSGKLSEEVVNAEPDLGKNDVSEGDWHQYGNTPYGQRYSPLQQINTKNVGNLKEVWRYQTGDVKLPEDVGETTYQVTPIKFDNTLYVCTPHNWAIAIDAATGKEIWKYDSNSGMNKDRQHQTCRGVSYYEDKVATAGAFCSKRVYLPTSDARLIALDAKTGQVCTSFADQGTLQLAKGMEYNPAGYYYSTSPPVITGDKIIIGGAVNDNFSTQSQSGVIRAFDVNTGELVWNWDSGNPVDTAPLAEGETYTTNSPNSWSVFSYDEALGLVYIPLGNQVPDQLGMGRSEFVEKYSSSIVALDINTGRDRWVRQTVHHDLWDMDVPAQPVLLDITQKDGTKVPALVGPTKQGDIYVLDRRTGEPLLDVTEVPAPKMGVIKEDFTAPTQPVSALSFQPDDLKESDMWGVSMIDQLACRIAFHKLNYEGRYTPPSLNGTIVYPGNFGVFNWGSVAVDPERQVMFGMPTQLAFTSKLVPRSEIPAKGADEKASEQGLNRNDGAPYGVFMGPFLGPLGVPCQAPGWGFVAGADLRTGEIAYKHRNGTVMDMTPLPLPFKVGVPGIGGPIITKGGVAFLGAAVDNYFRAYDLTTGEQLWEARLPAGGQSTPMTYSLDDGKQYVVMVAGGHGSIGTKAGDYIIAYALDN